MAQRAGEALLGVISDVLDFSKIEAGMLELDEHDFDLRQVVDDSCAMVSRQRSSKGPRAADLGRAGARRRVPR
jgi:signal transduction histidine kinase